MTERRVQRINSLLVEVLSEVIRQNVKDPRLPPLITITKVETAPDLRFAKVYVSVIGPEQDKILAVKVLEDAAGFIAVQASKKVVLRYFPSLTFKLDTSIEKHLRVDEILHKIHEEKNTRKVDEHSQ